MAGVAPGGPPQAKHLNLYQVRHAMDESEAQRVAWVVVGDSRSVGNQHHRGIGMAFRQYDVKHAALVCHLAAGGGAIYDGLGYLPTSLAGAVHSVAGPGDVTQGLGIRNTLPTFLHEVYTPEGGTQWTGVASVAYSTAGGAMNSNASLSSRGGTFYRGDPSLGRPLESIEYYFVTTRQPPPGGWNTTLVEFGFGGIPYGVGQTHFTTPLPNSPDDDLLITSRVLMHGTGSGQQITTRVRHSWLQNPTPAGSAFLLCGLRLNFRGDAGLVWASTSVGGYSTSDHLPQVVDIPGVGPTFNADWKYTDTGLREWLDKCVQVRDKTVVLEIALGQNSNTIGGHFQEWNGIGPNYYSRNIALVVERYRRAIADAGAARIVVLLVSPWARNNIIDPSYINAYRRELHNLAAARGWAYYDEEGELRDGGFSDAAGGGGIQAQYVSDGVHQNFAGMNLLGALRNRRFRSAVAAKPALPPKPSPLITVR